jgi:broad specificity phosphatase PhoE
MAVIYLVRHGQASWGAADYDVLSETGHAQGAVLGKALADRGLQPTRLVAGTMRRHAGTADAARAAAGWATPVEVDQGWDEFDHVQMLAVHGDPGSTDAEMSRADFDAWWDAAMARWIAGEDDEDYDEPFSAFTARVEGALARLAAGLGSGDVAVVFTSGGPVSWVAAHLLGGGADLSNQLNPVVANASYAKVVVGARGTTLVSFNEHGHLEPDHVTYR